MPIPGVAPARNYTLIIFSTAAYNVCLSSWNLTVVCDFHHDLIHKKHIGVKGRAPHALEWTPPKWMQPVLDRRRNRPSIWLGELDVREWSRGINRCHGSGGES